MGHDSADEAYGLEAGACGLVNLAATAGRRKSDQQRSNDGFYLLHWNPADTQLSLNGLLSLNGDLVMISPNHSRCRRYCR